MMHGFPDSQSNKRLQYCTERKQYSLESVSPSHSMESRFDDFVVLGDTGLVIEQTFSAGFLLDNSRMGNSNGKNLENSVMHTPKENGQVKTCKKARGEQVKIEKENSHSSMESDSRSSNFVFMQENDSATSNRIQNGRSLNREGNGGDELRGGFDRNNEGEFEDISRDDVVADSSWQVRWERSENHGSTDHDPLVESIHTLQSAQEALEKVVLKFREVGITDDPVDDLVPDSASGFASIDLKLHEISSSELIQSGKKLRSSVHSLHYNGKGVANRKYIETELEDLFRLKIEAEVEYLAVSTSVQELRVAAVNQITLLEEEKTFASEQARMLNMLENTRNKAARLKNTCEGIASAHEALKLQRKISKQACYFLVQFVVLVIILGCFLSHISPKHAHIVPT